MTLAIIVGHTLLVRRARRLDVGSPRAIEAFTVVVVGAAIAVSYVLTGGAASVFAFLGAAVATIVFARATNRSVPTNRSAKPFCHGDRGAMRSCSRPRERRSGPAIGAAAVLATRFLRARLGL
jgi:hypothetical protein